MILPVTAATCWLETVKRDLSSCLVTITMEKEPAFLFFLEKEAGYYKLSGEEHGFVVKIDTSGNILLSLPEKHYNR
ncbi:hypothetical protein E2320_005908, partial [Naja naja]